MNATPFLVVQCTVAEWFDKHFIYKTLSETLLFWSECDRVSFTCI